MADLNTLNVLFEDELRDVYDAEKQILRALPKIIKATSNDELRQALSSHLEETRGQVERLEQAFESLDLKPKGKHCAGMAGILEEGSDLLEEDGDDAVLDAGFIAGCQRVEHYEITAYGTLMAWAKLLGYRDAFNLLKANEQEEKAADAKLSKLAEATVNPSALSAGAEAEEEDDRHLGEGIDLLAGGSRLDRFGASVFCHTTPRVRDILIENIGIEAVHDAPRACAQADNLFALARSLAAIRCRRHGRSASAC